jgi:5-methylcytosine-specific restriction protein A
MARNCCPDSCASRRHVPTNLMRPPPRVATIGSRVASIDTRAVKPPPKQAAPIYSTPEYQAWRAKVIERARGICQVPGCGRGEHRMYADHIVELQDGGEPFDVANGQCLCGKHHTLKTNAERAKRHAR